MNSTSPTIPALTFSLPSGIAVFLTAASLAADAQAAVGEGASPAPISADGAALLGPDGNPITCTVQNFGVLDANNQPTSFTFKVAPLGATPNPSSDNTPTSMRIYPQNMSEIVASHQDYLGAEAQQAGSGVQAANDGGCNVEDLENNQYAVTFVADPA